MAAFNFIFDAIIPLVFMGMGLFLLSINNGWLQKRSKHYKDFTGKILSISKYESGGMSQSSSPQVKFGVKLEYEYGINGQNFVNDIIFKNADTIASSDEAWADGFIREYPVGKVVLVKVNPLVPKDTYLIEKSPTTGFFNVFGVVAIVSGVLIYYFTR